jgi:hypothetical protein
MSNSLPAGAGMYNVLSEKKEALEIINKYGIKYITLSDGYFCTNLFRKNGFYGYNVIVDKRGEVSYKPISKQIADELQLKPDFNWWNKHGSWLAIILGIVIILLKILDFAGD